MIAIAYNNICLPTPPHSSGLDAVQHQVAEVPAEGGLRHLHVHIHVGA